MEFRLPEIGEGVHEGELIRWLVKEGDTVAADQPLMEVMTDKATVEVPAPQAGKIQGLQAKDGDMIKVGQVLATIAEGASSSQAAAPSAAPATPAAAPSEKSAATPVAAPQESKPTAPQVTIPPQGASRSPYVGSLDALTPESVPAAPVVRAMAQKSGVDLSSVPGTGPEVGGRKRVLEEDLLRFLNNGGVSQAPAGASSAGGGLQMAANYAPTLNPSRAPSASTPQKAVLQMPVRHVNGGEEIIERKPLRGIRRAISNAMVRSKFTAPHYSYVDEFECSSLVELREQAKASAEKYGVKFSYLPFIVKAVVGALKEFPQVNASLEEGNDGQTLALKKFYHIGIAVNTPDGLLVPVIKHADQKSLLEIAQEIADLSERTRAGKASAEDLKGSTFTITSMGNVGGLFATPIINYPEVGIMGVYRIQEKPIVRDGQIVVGKTMHLSLSLDHRVVDGVVGAEFCNAVIARLAQPARLMLEMI